jgi:O-antigen/teichoic acid export membrane protein
MQSEKIAPAKIDIADTSVNQDIITAAKGGGILFFGRIFEEFSQVIYVILLARVLGTSGYGLYNLGIGIESILAVIALMGLAEGMVRFIPIELAKHNNEKIRNTVFVGVSVSLVIGISLGLILFITAPFTAVNIFHDTAAIPILKLIAITIPLEAFGQILLGAVLGLKRMDYQVYSYSIVYSLVRIGLTVLLLYIGWNVAGAIIAYSVAWAVTIGLLLYFINRSIKLKKPEHISRLEVQKLLSFSAPLCLTDITIQLRSYVNLLMIGAMGTMTSVGVYSVAMRVQMAGLLLLGPIMKVAKPIISDLDQRAEVGRLEQVYQTLTRWSFTIILPVAITIFLFARPILSVFGDDYVTGASVLIIIGFGLLISGATWISQPMISMMGHSGLTFFITSGGLVLTVLFNVILIPRWNITGAALAFLIVTIIISIVCVLEVYFLRKLLPYNLTFVKPIFAGILTFFLGMLLDKFIPAESNFLYFFLDVLLLWLIYILALVLLGLSEEDRAVLSRVSRKVNSFRKSIKPV